MNRIAQHCAYNILSLFAIIKTKCHDIGVVGTIIIRDERVQDNLRLIIKFFETNYDAIVRLQVLFLHTLWNLRYARVYSAYII